MHVFSSMLWTEKWKETCDKRDDSIGVPFQFGSCESVFLVVSVPLTLLNVVGLCTRQALISKARTLLQFSVS